MSRKVTIIGYTGSGKTTYLIGMYAAMSGFGQQGYSLTAGRDEELRLNDLWDRMQEGHFPAANNLSESYEFCLSKGFEPVTHFTWLDYPGGLLDKSVGNDREKLSQYIESSDTLFLVFDGEVFKSGDLCPSDYERRLKNKLKNAREIKRVISEVGILSSKGICIPPICVILTKSDLICEGRSENEIPEIYRIVKKVMLSEMKSLFENRAVYISCVSLGSEKDIQMYGPEPMCVEEPIAFAVMNIALSQMEALSGLKGDASKTLDKKRNWFTRWLDKEEIESARKEYNEFSSKGKQWTRNALDLLNLFPADTNIYVNGLPEDFHSYMRRRFNELA